MSAPGLFSLENLAHTVEIPRAPELAPHQWPFPGLTPVESAQASWMISAEYDDMLAAVIKTQGGAALTSQQVLALVPKDWRNLLGRFAHGQIGCTAGEQRGIQTNYVHHDGGGYHFTHQAIESMKGAA